MTMFVSAFVCGVASALYLFRRHPERPRGARGAELTALFGVIVLISGPLWARKAWASGGTGTPG